MKTIITDYFRKGLKICFWSIFIHLNFRVDDIP